MSSANEVRSHISWIGIGSGVAAALLAIYAVLGDPRTGPEQTEQARTLPYVVVFALVFAAAVFMFLVPWAARATNHTRRPTIVGFVCSLLSLLLLLPAVWSGLPIILGGAGFALGQVGREHASTTGQRVFALITVVIGVLSVLGSVAITLLDHFMII
jgi:hypothetical protein